MTMKGNQIVTDNSIFALHYKVTVAILALYCLLVIQFQYFDNPIVCKGSSLPDIDLGQQQCWTQYSYHRYEENPHYLDSEPRAYRASYQWVPFVLLCQALMFYLPRYIWKQSEGGKMAMLTKGLHLPLLDDALMERKKNDLVSYMRRNLHKQNLYFYNFFFCEIYNCVNVAIQFYIIYLFVGQDFQVRELQVTPQLFMRPQWQAWKEQGFPLNVTFPDVNRCTFTKSGPSGSIERHALMCFLPVNTYHQKAFLVFSIWYLILSGASLLSVLFRVLTWVLRPLRRVLLRWKVGGIESSHIDTVARKTSVGDWFVLYQVAKNIDAVAFKLFLTDFAKEL